MHDGAGNITSDTRSGTAYAYTYNKRNRLKNVTGLGGAKLRLDGVLKSTYTYNGLEQTAIRVTTNMTPSGTTHFIYDRAGNLIAETDGTGVAGTTREYIWLPEAEIAPGSWSPVSGGTGSRTVVAEPSKATMSIVRSRSSAG